jgi:phosphoribosylformylglycinamidine synthase subunit PurL
MGQFVRAIQGIGEACRALDFPIVSGNVSLYNETNGQGILPTPAIGGIGLIPDLDHMATIPFKAAGDAILLVGGHGSHLGQSIYLREVLGREEGAPPPVDLEVEKRNGDFVRSLIKSGQVTAVHDISDGGLGLCGDRDGLASGFGASLVSLTHEQLFGEDQARYVFRWSAPALSPPRLH